MRAPGPGPMEARAHLIERDVRLTLAQVEHGQKDVRRDDRIGRSDVMKKPDLKIENAALKKEVKHLKGLLREAVGILQKYKNIVVSQAEKPIAQSKRKAATRKKTAKAARPE